MPVVEQTKLVGVLYLENSLTPYAFTSSRLAVLELLASQAAISLENARLYSEVLRENTERKQAEGDLRRSEAFLAEGQRLSRTGSWSWIALSDEVTWSEHHFRVLGFDPEATKPSLQIFWERIHPEDRPVLQRHFDRAIHGKSDFACEFRIVLPDGTIRHMHGIGHPVVNDFDELVEFVGTTMDITERKRAEEEVRKQAALLSLAHDAIFVRDLENRIVFWNRGAENVYGWTTEEALGTVTHELLKTRFPIPPNAVDAAIWEQGKWEGELTHTTRQGTPIVVASRWSLQRDEYGAPSAVLEINSDITERKEAEEALRQTQADLAHVTRATTLSELSASIAHEVNQPLAAIVTNGEVCLRWLDRAVPDLAEMREAVGAMISDGRRASEIIRRLRALSTKTETQKVAFDINDAISEIIPVVQQEVVNHRVALRLELTPRPLAVLADRVQLQQVIINLLVNGIEAMVAVTDRSRELVIRSQLDDRGQVLVAVEDWALASSLTTQTSSSTPSSRPSPAEWEWGCRSAVRS